MDFEANAGDPGAQAPAPTNDPLAELVGEGKPFKDVAALAASKVEADAFIEQLKGENSQMRGAVKEAEEKLSRSSTTAEILEAVRGMTTQGQPNEPVIPTGEGDAGNQPNITEDDIAELIQRTLSKTEQDKTKEANFNSVKKGFMEFFKDSDKARLAYKAAAVALEMSEDQLDVFSKQSPHLVLRAAGLEPAFKSETNPPSYLQSNVNSEHDAGNTPKRDHAWWEAQRKEKGNTWYFSTKTQQRYWEDAKAIGDSFLPKE